jgi:hypothetical protein
MFVCLTNLICSHGKKEDEELGSGLDRVRDEGAKVRVKGEGA